MATRPLAWARRELLVTAAAGLSCACAGGPRSAADGPGPYVCPPCGCAMDGEEFAAPGACPACGMTLIPKNPEFEPEALVRGASLFETSGGPGRENARIGVHYYWPESWRPDSPVLLVLPGSGRNADDYRDAWIEAADAAGVLVAALSYPESDYDFAAYQMGGVIKDLVVRNMPPPGPDGQLPSRIHLRDEDISFALNLESETWLFSDFDRVFALIAAASGSTRTSYDLFGHSAGGQILHRTVVFWPRSNAGRIVAANGGQYTQLNPALPAPVGVEGYGLSEESTRKSFACDLTLLLGELDNDDETRGELLHTPLLDQFGDDRLSRGLTFFQAGQEQARALGAEFNWSLETVPNVGHDFRAMSRAAALRLYG